MKSVLIIANDMEIGGAERALVGLLNEMDTKKYDIDLFLLKHRGPFMEAIPENIRLLPQNEKYASLAVPMIDVIKRFHFGILAGRLFGKIKAKQFKRKSGIHGITSVGIQYSYKYTKNFLPMINKKTYDAVIAFTFPYYIPVEKVKAKKRIAWIHTDYTKIPGDRIEEEKVWNQYETLVAVSSGVKESFIKIFPDLENKVQIIENILPSKLIMKQINDGVDIADDGRIKLLSIGRYTSAKNFDNVPEVCARILEKGLDVSWYIIGYGQDEELIRDRIKACKMENRVFLLGKKENPYPYLKWCDYYIQPSRFEGQSISVREAQLLKKIVIITNYPTSSSQIINGKDGVIVPLNNIEMAEGIAETIRNKDKQEKILTYLNSRNYSKRDEVEKLYKIID